MDNAANLTARELRYSLGTRRLINDVSLSLAGGEMVAIIGPNGAGKSTLLRLLTGYLTPDCGECRLLGRPLEHWAPQQLAKVRAVMRQYSDLAFPFSVEEVVSMGRAPHGKRDEHQAIQQVMAQTDCLALAQRDYRQLSGGEQQRVQLARVLAQLWQPQPSPAWLFLDEPTSALDLYHQQHTLRLLRSLTRQQPLGVCCVLHDLNLAALVRRPHPAVASGAPGGERHTAGSVADGNPHPLVPGRSRRDSSSRSVVAAGLSAPMKRSRAP